MSYLEVDAGTFRHALQEALKTSRFGAGCHVYTRHEYETMRCYLAEDGWSGFAIIPDHVRGGELVSVFSDARGPNRRLAPLMTAAAWHGARRLNTFDTGLPARYAEFGWVEVDRVKWDDQYAPADWPYSELGRPDVVYMEYHA